MPVPHCMFSAGRCVVWCPLAGAESDFCGRNGRWKGLIFRHNRVFVQNQGAVLKKSSLRGVHPVVFPSRQSENERRPTSCAHSSRIKRSTLLCRKMTRVHPDVSFPLIFSIAVQKLGVVCMTAHNTQPSTTMEIPRGSRQQEYGNVNTTVRSSSPFRTRASGSV